MWRGPASLRTGVLMGWWNFWTGVALMHGRRQDGDGTLMDERGQDWGGALMDGAGFMKRGRA